MRIKQLLQSKIVTWIEKFRKYLSFVSKFKRNIKKLSGLKKKEILNVQFATTLFIYQLGYVFALGEGRKRLKGESILAWFHFPNFLSFSGHVFVIVNFCLMIGARLFYICVRLMLHFFIY